jgi:hypothetical protein
MAGCPGQSALLGLLYSRAVHHDDEANLACKARALEESVVTEGRVPHDSLAERASAAEACGGYITGMARELGKR